MGKKRKASSPLQSASPPATTGASTPGQQNFTRDEIDALRQEVSELKKRLYQMEMHQDFMEQQSRLNCLIFSGSAVPEAVNGENRFEQ